MDMGMSHERLSPRMQYRQNSDLTSKMFGIGGEYLERPRRHLKQQVVDYLFVLKRHQRDFLWQREHHVEVWNW